MKPSRLAAMWIVTREFVFGIWASTLGERVHRRISSPCSWLVYDRDILDRRTDLEIKRVGLAISRRCRELAPPTPGRLWLDRWLKPCLLYTSPSPRDS